MKRMLTALALAGLVFTGSTLGGAYSERIMAKLAAQGAVFLGTGAGSVKASGLLCSTNAYTDAAVQSQWNSQECTIPANSFSTTGNALTWDLATRLASNANTKQFQFWLAASTATCSGTTNATACDSGCQIDSAVSQTSTGNNVSSYGRGTILRTGSSTQTSGYTHAISTAVNTSQENTCTITDTAAMKFVVAVRNTSAGAATLTRIFMVVKAGNF